MSESNFVINRVSIPNHWKETKENLQRDVLSFCEEMMYEISQQVKSEFSKNPDFDYYFKTASRGSAPAEVLQETRKRQYNYMGFHDVRDLYDIFTKYNLSSRYTSKINEKMHSYMVNWYASNKYRIDVKDEEILKFFMEYFQWKFKYDGCIDDEEEYKEKMKEYIVQVLEITHSRDSKDVLVKRK